MPIIRDIDSGDIYHTWCPFTMPAKNKYHTFLEDGFFFLINSKYWKDSIPLLHDNYNFLPHEVSHLNYSNLFAYPTNNSIQTNSKKGNLNVDTIQLLKEKIPYDEILTPEQQRQIIQYLDNMLYDG